jgi:hypothetical protein
MGWGEGRVVATSSREEDNVRDAKRGLDPD